MKIIRRQDERKAYTVVKKAKKAYALVRIINMYETEDEALTKMFQLLDGTENEADLIQQFTKSDW